MKILLLNDNPVVNKLVTLSAQKTSDTLDVVDNVESIEGDNYDLLVVDDTLYSDEVMSMLNEKITFSKSLYIRSRDAEAVDSFTSTLVKPFLPTDLVELFATFGQEISSETEIDNNEEIPELEDIDLENDSIEEEDDEDTLELDDIDLESDEVLDLDELNLEDDISEENIEEELEIDDLEELELEDDLDLELELEEDEDDSVLDKDDLQEVQDLLEDVDLESDSESSKAPEVNELEELSLENDSSETDELEEELDLDMEVNLESDAESDEVSEVNELEEFSLESDSSEAEEDKEVESETEELDFEIEEPEPEIELDEIEEQIQEAEENLTEEDLAQEVDEEILMDIADLDSLTSNDLKLAIGEEVDVESDDESETVSEVNLESDAESSEVSEVNELEELSLESDSNETADNDGVDALKKLLKALTDKDVAASMKGMKININITLGDN